MSPTDPKPTGVAPRSRKIEWLKPRPLAIAAVATPTNDFTMLLRSRRTTRHLGKASLREVAAAVRETLRADFIGTGLREGRKKKRVISAGALHPVKCVVIDQDEGPIFYDDEEDAFVSVAPRNPNLLTKFIEQSEVVLPSANGHLIGLIADIRDLAVAYEHHETLLWRDAGAVLQTLALVSEAFGLGFCPLGIKGQELADALLEGDEFVGVGVAVIGSRLP